MNALCRTHAETRTYGKGQARTHNTEDFGERLGSVSETIEMCPNPYPNSHSDRSGRLYSNPTEAPKPNAVPGMER